MIRVLEYAGRNKLPVLVLEYHGEGSTIDVLKEKVDSLATTVTYVAKPHDSGFKNTDLDERLKQLSVSEVVLMGINASACVKATGESALKNGFGITTSLDLITDHPSVLSPLGIGHRSVNWYKQHGVVAPNHRDLLRTISQKEMH